MSISFVLILFVVFSAGALLAAWAGIRSLQSARSVVFYRTRNARMMAGWQWLAASLVMATLAIAAISFGESIVDRFLSPTVDSASPTAVTGAASPTLPGTGTPLPRLSPTLSAQATQTLTPTAPVTPSRTPSYLGTYTAFAIWTERRSTFIAYLSSTPTASRTPIPTWTLTPSSTPRPTYTASPTRTPRTPRPTFSPSPTRTPRPTWTPSATRTPRPTNTPSSTHTLTSASTRTATPTP